MIKCKPYRVTYQTPNTCISNQIELIDLRKQIKKKKKKYNAEKKRGRGGGIYQILAQTPPSRYYSIEHCDGCEIGLELYHESLGKKKKEKTMHQNEIRKCRKCGEMFPGDRDHFDYAPKTGLTVQCRWCRGTADTPRPAKKSEEVKPAPVTEEPKETQVVICNVCKEPLPQTTENFHRNASYEDGFDKTCKKCRNDRKVAKRRGRKFDREGAEKIAADAAERSMALVSVFVKDPDTLDQIKAVAVQVGVESQRAAYLGAA